jgi:hypothetical protein
MKKINILLLILYGIFVSCSRNNEKTIIDTNSIRAKPRYSVSYDTSSYKKLNIIDFIDAGVKARDKKADPENILYTKRILKGNIVIFVYSYKSNKVKDSLVINPNSELYFNNEKLELLNEKELVYKGSKITVSKYLYEHKANLTTSNLFINDSLGIITSRAQRESVLLREYNEKYNELHTEIFNDTSFFKLEYYKEKK